MFRTLVDRLKSRPGAYRPRAQRRSFRPLVESLEDRHTPAAMLTIGEATVVEGNDGVQFAEITVSLTEPHGNNVMVNFATADGTAKAGTDYTAVSGKLTFTKNEITKTVRVPIPGDRVAEDGGYFAVRLSGAKGAKIAQSEGFVTILDDEPRVSISSASKSEGNSGDTPMAFQLTLYTPTESGTYDLPVTVQYTTVDGSATAGNDYTATSGSWTFQPGENSHTITVMVKGDRVPEFLESFRMNLSTADGYAQVFNGTGYGTIYDDEPRITIYDAYNYGDGLLTFGVYLSNAYDEPVTVDFTTADGTAIAGVDYFATAGTLTFAPGEVYQSITVQMIDPAAVTDAYFYVQLSGGPAYAAIDYTSAVGYLGYFDYWYWYDPGYSYDPYGYYW